MNNNLKTNHTNINNKNNSFKNNIINPKESIIRNNNDKKPLKIDKETLEPKLSERDKILFPNLKVNKPPSTIINTNANNYNSKVFSQRDFMNSKKRRSFSSGG